MPAVEYMLHNTEGDHRRQVPGFIGDRGHWYNPSNHTYVGWVSNYADFYVPNTVKVLTKDDFRLRIESMHAQNPLKKAPPGAAGGPMFAEQSIDMTIEEVRASADAWFDNFVSENAHK